MNKMYTEKRKSVKMLSIDINVKNTRLANFQTVTFGNIEKYYYLYTVI